MPGSLRVTQIKSAVSSNPDARRTVRALGLHRIGETVQLPDNPAVRGQIRAVRYLLDVTEDPGPAKTSRDGRKASASAAAGPGKESNS